LGALDLLVQKVLQVLVNGDCHFLEAKNNCHFPEPKELSCCLLEAENRAAAEVDAKRLLV